MVVEDWANLQREYEANDGALLPPTKQSQTQIYNQSLQPIIQVCFKFYDFYSCILPQKLPAEILLNIFASKKTQSLNHLLEHFQIKSYTHIQVQEYPNSVQQKVIKSFYRLPPLFVLITVKSDFLKSAIIFDVIYILAMPDFKQQLSQVLKGLRNGLQYGSKVRFVHTLVMTLLFKDIHLKKFPSLLKNILSMAIQHGKNLGLFVLSYKSCYKILNYLFKENSWNHFISGFVFGSLIFGNKTGVNSQIVLYLLSRVVIGLLTLIYKKIGELGHPKWTFIEKGYGYYLLSAIVWGIVMWLFEKQKDLLQPSLRHSMEFLYKQSDNVSRWTDFIPYYPKQKKQKLKNEITETNTIKTQ